MMSQEFKRGGKWRTNSPAYLFLQLIQQFQVATRNTSPNEATVFHTWLYGTFIGILSSPRRKKFHRMNQGSSFLGGTFSDRDNIHWLTDYPLTSCYMPSMCVTRSLQLFPPFTLILTSFSLELPLQSSLMASNQHFFGKSWLLFCSTSKPKICPV